MVVAFSITFSARHDANSFSARVFLQALSSRAHTRDMATPFLIGCGVAAAAYAARGALMVAESAKANPELKRQLGAAAAGFRGMGHAFKVPDFVTQAMGRSTDGGFEATMSRNEAGKILGIRCAAHARQLPASLALL
jgi:hypothetical protein